MRPGPWPFSFKVMDTQSLRSRECPLVLAVASPCPACTGLDSQATLGAAEPLVPPEAKGGLAGRLSCLVVTAGDGSTGEGAPALSDGPEQVWASPFPVLAGSRAGRVVSELSPW